MVIYDDVEAPQTPKAVTYDEIRARYSQTYGQGAADNATQSDLLTTARQWYGDDVQVTGYYQQPTVGGTMAAPDNSGVTTGQGQTVVGVVPGEQGRDSAIVFTTPGTPGTSVYAFKEAPAEMRQAAANYAAANNISLFDSPLNPAPDENGFKVNGPVVVIPNIGGSSFEESRKYLSQLPNGTPVRFENSPTISFVWGGGLLNSSGKYYTGYGPAVASRPPSSISGKITGEVQGPQDTYASPITAPVATVNPSQSVWSTQGTTNNPGRYIYAPLGTSSATRPVEGQGNSNLMMLSFASPGLFKPLADIGIAAYNLYSGYIKGVAAQRDADWAMMNNDEAWNTFRNKSLPAEQRKAAFIGIAQANSNEALSNLPLDGVGGMQPGISWGAIIRRTPGPVASGYNAVAGVTSKSGAVIGGAVQGTIDRVGARSAVNRVYTISTESVGKQVIDYTPQQIRNIPGQVFSPTTRASVEAEFVSTEWAEYNTINAAREKIAAEELFTGNPNLGYGGQAGAAIESKPYTYGYALEVETPPAAQIGIGTYGPASPFDAPGIVALPGDRSMMWVPENNLKGFLAPENPTIVRSYFPISYEDYTRIAYPNKMPVSPEYVPVYGPSEPYYPKAPTEGYEVRINNRLNDMFPNAGTYVKTTPGQQIRGAAKTVYDKTLGNIGMRVEFVDTPSVSAYRSVPTTTEQALPRYQTEITSSKMFSSSSEIDDFTSGMFRAGGETKIAASATANEGFNMIRTGLFSGIASITASGVRSININTPTTINPVISRPTPADDTIAPISVPSPVTKINIISEPMTQPIIVPSPGTTPDTGTVGGTIFVPPPFKPFNTSGKPPAPPTARPAPFIIPSFDFGGQKSYVGRSGKVGAGYVHEIKNPFLSSVMGAKKKAKKRGEKK